ncbi:hypothetical protein DL89DRAFT_172960 [Linderina pennispora]|uniref:Uncharacterized protein n=1 Tax=Linderina pennispora TaxID=61395 RepID=A0A1Y1W760_9FUNG|nr:uncharacterized protein DL89DRAFT_172960 [Linderina pennispora]ORX69205.1 hypothetical protein DL89DRAFT_172960 [Linderina pennispora]
MPRALCLPWLSRISIGIHAGQIASGCLLRAASPSMRDPYVQSTKYSAWPTKSSRLACEHLDILDLDQAARLDNGLIIGRPHNLPATGRHSVHRHLVVELVAVAQQNAVQLHPFGNSNDRAGTGLLVDAQ